MKTTTVMMTGATVLTLKEVFSVPVEWDILVMVLKETV